MTDTQRNFLILAGIAVIVFVLNSSGTNVNTNRIFQVLNWAFVILGLIAYGRFRVRNNTTVKAMAPRDRLLFDGGTVAIVVVWITGRIKPAWSVNHGGGASLLFILAIVACGYAIYTGWSNRRTSYW